jgi:hypothetical protein
MIGFSFQQRLTDDGLDHANRSLPPAACPIVDRLILMHVTLRLTKSFFFFLATPRAPPSPLPGRGRGPWGLGRRFVGFWPGWGAGSQKEAGAEDRRRTGSSGLLLILGSGVLGAGDTTRGETGAGREA